MIPRVFVIVESAVNGFEKCRRVGKDGDVLDIWIVFGHVGAEMVDIMRALPPPNRQATAKVGNKRANQSISDKVARDATMACVVSREHDLLL